MTPEKNYTDCSPSQSTLHPSASKGKASPRAFCSYGETCALDDVVLVFFFPCFTYDSTSQDDGNKRVSRNPPDKAASAVERPAEPEWTLRAPFCHGEELEQHRTARE